MVNKASQRIQQIHSIFQLANQIDRVRQVRLTQFDQKFDFRKRNFCTGGRKASKTFIADLACI